MLAYIDFKKSKALPKDTPFRVYGVTGDSFLQKRVIDSLLDWLLPADVRDFNLDTLDGDTSNLTEVLSRCGNLPFLADSRVVLVRRAERLENLYRLDERAPRKSSAKPAKSPKKSSKAPTAQERFLQALRTLPPTTTLILARSPESPEPGARLENESCIAQVVDEAIESSAEIPSLFINCLLTGKNQNRATNILQDEAQRLNIPLAPDAAAYIIERAGSDLWHLLNELQKCAWRVGNGQIVTTSVIEEMVRPALHDTIFSLTDALGNRQTARAIGILRELLASGEEPITLLPRIVSHFRHLLQARALLDAGLAINPGLTHRLPATLAEQLPDRPFYEKPLDGYDNFAKLAESQSWRARKMADQARQFTTEQIQAVLEAALEADLAMKGISADITGEAEGGTPELLLELAVLNFGQ